MNKGFTGLEQHFVMFYMSIFFFLGGRIIQ